MKAGDKVWAVTTVVSIEPNGVIYGDWDMHDPACVIPHTEALPAVARWLAEHGDALRYGQHTPGDWLDVVEAAFDDQVDGVTLVDVVMPALRALLAALTTEETA